MGSPLLGWELFLAGGYVCTQWLCLHYGGCPPLCSAWGWWDTSLPLDILTSLSLGGGIGTFMFALGFGVRVQLE